VTISGTGMKFDLDNIPFNNRPTILLPAPSPITGKEKNCLQKPSVPQGESELADKYREGSHLHYFLFLVCREFVNLLNIQIRFALRFILILE